MVKRKKKQDLRVPNYVKSHVVWGYEHYQDLNAVLKKLSPGDELSAQAWAMLAAVGSWKATNYIVTQRLIKEAIIQSGVAQREPFNLHGIYSQLYRAGSSHARLCEVKRDSQFITFHPTQELVVIWQHARNNGSQESG